MNKKNITISGNIPVTLNERIKREREKNGYSKPFPMKIGLFLFLELTHAERIAAMQRLNEFYCTNKK
jgi:hypothetical protein